MSTATKSPAKKTPTRAAQHGAANANEMLPASCELPASVHAKVSAAASANERSFAAQLRLIAREWADRQPATR
jgi:hypothetical protein